MRPSIMRISEAALLNNAQAIRSALPQHVKMMCVVKADAYGHGSVQAAKVMLRAGADAFAVAIVEEARQLRAAGILNPILILGGACDDSLREAVLADAAQAVYLPRTLDILQRSAQILGRPARAHLKLDTGMSRIGVRNMADLEQLLSHWRYNCPDVRMEGAFTHLCAVDEDPEFTRSQNVRFNEMLACVRDKGFAPVAHAAASSAMFNPECQYDMVRAGIGLYGTLVPALKGQLQYAQTLITRPIRIERISAGDTVGYGRNYTAERDTYIMTLPIGYGDGYPRVLSNRAEVLVCGRRAPIVGNVCMDMFMVDITDVPGVTLQSEVVLMGAQGDERITPEELARKANTIPYEIMLGFSARIRKEHEAIEREE